MDFMVGLPKNQQQYDSICMVVDRLTKLPNVIPVNSTNSTENYAMIFIDCIEFLHGIPLSNISDRGAQFTCRFWRSSQEGLGTKVKLSTTFHP